MFQLLSSEYTIDPIRYAGTPVHNISMVTRITHSATDSFKAGIEFSSREAVVSVTNVARQVARQLMVGTCSAMYLAQDIPNDVAIS